MLMLAAWLTELTLTAAATTSHVIFSSENTVQAEQLEDMRGKSVTKIVF